MASWRENFLSMPVEARSMYARKIGKKCRGNYPDFNEMVPEYMIPRHTRFEMMEWAKSHGATTRGELALAIQKHPDEDPPTIPQIEFMFGTLREFFQTIYKHPKVSFWGRSITDEDLAQCCSRLKVRTWEKYEELQKKPQFAFLPSIREIDQRFGSWNLFKQLMLTYDVDLNVREYFKKSMVLGAPLTLQQCDKLGIELRYLQEVLGKKVMAMLLREQEKVFMDSLSEEERKKYKIQRKFKDEDTRRDQERAGEAVRAQASAEGSQEDEGLL